MSARGYALHSVCPQLSFFLSLHHSARVMLYHGALTSRGFSEQGCFEMLVGRQEQWNKRRQRSAQVHDPHSAWVLTPFPSPHTSAHSIYSPGKAGRSRKDAGNERKGIGLRFGVSNTNDWKLDPLSSTGSRPLINNSRSGRHLLATNRKTNSRQLRYKNGICFSHIVVKSFYYLLYIQVESFY